MGNQFYTLVECNQVNWKVWDCCVSSEIWFWADHISWKENIVASKMSRKFSNNSAWKLRSDYILRVINFFSKGWLICFTVETSAICILFTNSRLQIKRSRCICTVLVLTHKGIMIQDRAMGIVIIPLWAALLEFPLIL